MRYRRTLVSRPPGRCLAVILCAAVCASFLAAAAVHTNPLPGAGPQEIGIWKKRIKRLRPADPESSEEMLARAGADSPPLVRG